MNSNALLLSVSDSFTHRRVFVPEEPPWPHNTPFFLVISPSWLQLPAPQLVLQHPQLSSADFQGLKNSRLVVSLSELGIQLWGWRLGVQFPTVFPKPTCVALGKVGTPEEGNGKPVLNTFYLENPEKDCHKSELTGQHTIIIGTLEGIDLVKTTPLSFCWQIHHVTQVLLTVIQGLSQKAQFLPARRQQTHSAITPNCG